MIKLNEQSREKEITSIRNSAYGILTNEEGLIAVVRHENWGLILPGGKKEENEESVETIIRETLEEIGYEIKLASYLETIEDYYDIVAYKKEWYTHQIADFYCGNILTKIEEPMETNTSLEWFTPKELLGKLKLDFQNKALEIYIDLINKK